MARIKNMGTSTMKFGEGAIIEGTAGSDSHALIVTGSIHCSTDGYFDRIYLGGGDGTGSTLSNGNTETHIQLQGNDVINLVAGGKNFIQIVEGSTNSRLVINENSKDIDFRVETDNNDFAIFTDAANDVVYLGGFPSAEPAGSDVILYVSGTTPANGGGKGTQAGATVFNSDLVVSGTYRGGYDPNAGSESFQAVSDSFFFLSNDADFGGSQIEALDSNFFVSGAIGSRGGDTPGTAVFGGDILVSGTLNAVNGGTINISQGTSFPQNAFRVDSSLGTMFAAYGSPADVDLTAPAVYVNPANNNIDFFVKTGPNDKAAIVVDAEREYIAFMSGGLDSASTSNPLNMSDTNFLVSGSIGSKGGGTRGTAVFGGDVVMSGSLDVNNVSITTDGNIGIGNTSPNDALDVTGNVRISNYLRLNCAGTTDPTGRPPLQDHAHIYSKLTGGTAEVFVQDSDGNVTQISPHNPAGEWHYFSRNTRTGKVVRVNMEKMIRKLEEITGESFMEEWYEDPTD